MILGFSEAQAVDKSIFGFDFTAPSILSKSTVPGPAVGAIVYETGTRKFFGYDHTGTWLQMSQTPIADAVCEIWVSGLSSANSGYGSGDTSVFRFNQTAGNETRNNCSGGEIVRTTSSTDGDKFTIATDGLYAINLTVQGSGSGGTQVGLTLNASGTQLDNAITAFIGANPEVVLAYSLGESDLATAFVSTSGVFYLQSGDVVRPQGGNSIGTSYDAAIFRMTKVSP